MCVHVCSYVCSYTISTHTEEHIGVCLFSQTTTAQANLHPDQMGRPNRQPTHKKKLQKKSFIVSFCCKRTGTLTFEIFFLFFLRSVSLLALVPALARYRMCYIYMFRPNIECVLSYRNIECVLSYRIYGMCSLYIECVLTL